MTIGDKVIFTGHGTLRAKEYGYAELFGDGPHTVVDTRESCCNKFIVLEDIDGMYNQQFFKRVP